MHWELLEKWVRKRKMGHHRCFFYLGGDKKIPVPKFRVWVELLVINPELEKLEELYGEANIAGYRFRVCTRDPNYYIGVAWKNRISENTIALYDQIVKNVVYINNSKKKRKRKRLSMEMILKVKVKVKLVMMIFWMIGMQPNLKQNPQLPN